MLELDISSKCQQEWSKTLNENLYPEPDDELIELMHRIINRSASQDDIKKTVMKLAKNFGVRIENVSFISKEDLRNGEQLQYAGGFVKNKNSIVFNFSEGTLEDNQGIDLLDTIVHELRHAQQNQKLKYMDSELGRLISDSIANYRCSTDSLHGLSVYYTNFTEIDAETFAKRYIRHLVEKIREKKSVPSMVDAEIRESENKAQTAIQASRELIYHNRNSIEVVYNAFEKYMKTVLSSPTLTKEEKNELAKKLIEQSIPFVEGNGREYFGFSLGHLNYLQDLIYKDSDPFVILDNLDNEFIKYIEKLEVKYRDLGLNKYQKYTTHLRSIVTKCEYLLMSKHIEFDKNNPSETVKKAFEILPNEILESIGRPKNEAISKIDDLLLSISVYMPNQSKKLMAYTKELIEDTLSEEQLAKFIEKNVQSDDVVCYCGTYEISSYLLDGYYSDYRMETFGHPRENLLKTMGVRYNKDNFLDIRDKFNKNFPKYLLKCLLKPSLSDEEKGYVFSYEHGSFGDIDKDLLEKEIRGNILIQHKLAKVIQDKENPVLKAFEKRGINLADLIKKKHTK